ncbi:uncharacterized protein BO88DRAFT_369251 [Aspergillus vadensis CBS 113365]|uniref:Mid2 domain-containing protein n=1 Tax=Aspergillus vadensis (strain CBS 113365 / IMI 142717 / IBT 24658) TaxID=1448311 RepID=A0A319B5W1_ASPVC|nr:hypothetical protein BO88DRAFT_369251 [Aspergillus vadensis CBS 113365]PYH67194.1 hypothetical protein BO88DRAFT_369251 [Aspergillus vadensis CBS 113365]
MKRIMSAFWMLFPSYLSPAAATACYAADGSPVDNSIYQPCVPITGIHSMCCRLNSADNETCDPTGLCLTSGGGYHRGLCTDQSWNSTNCLPKDICDNQHGGYSDWTYQLTSCGDGCWCCGSSTSCCSTPETFTLDPTVIKLDSASKAAATAAPAITVTIIPTESSSSNDGEVDRSAKVAIGLGVGVPLACIAVGMLGGGYLLGRRSMRRVLSQVNLQPRVKSVLLEKPKGEIGRPLQVGDAPSTS